MALLMLFQRITGIAGDRVREMRPVPLDLGQNTYGDGVENLPP